MAAKYGDAFCPVSNYFAEPIDGGNIGVELEWAESEADFKAGRLQIARLFLSPDAAEEFAAELRRQVEAARQRKQPN
jgi:hypothetical protein